MMSDKLRAAAQAALDAMSVVRVFVTSKEKIKHPEGTDWYDNIRINLDENIVNNIKEMNAIEAALAEPTVKESLTTAEPEEKLLSIHLLDQWLKASLAEQKPMLEMNPQKREFVGLTGPEVDAAYKSVSDKEWSIGGLTDARVFFCAIEAKLREKNA
jgi:hypothetical protein